MRKWIGLIHFIHRILRLKSITSRLFFWVFILVFLTSVLYVFLYINVDKNNRISNAKENLDYGLLNQQIILENWAVDRAEEVRLLASFPVTKNLQLDTMVQRFQYYHQYYDQLDAIVFIDKNGFVNIDTASSELIITDSDVSLKDRDYFIAAKQGEEYIYDVVVSKSSGDPTIIFSAPVLSTNNEFQGVIFSAVYLSKVNHMLSQSLQGESGEITLINEEGYIVSHLSNNSDHESEQEILATKLDTNILDEISTKDKGFFEYVNHQGREVFGTFISLYDGRYYLINEISKREVLQPHYQMITFMIIITIIIVIVGFVLMIPVSYQLLRPFFYLVKAINRMKAGKYNTQLNPDKFQTSPFELQQMMEGFNEMATSIQENKKLLERISNTDGLTGIANRRLFEEQLEKECQYAIGYQKPISLVFIDIDYFKKYNDSFGHQKGDKCLIKIAHAIDNIIKSPDHLVARYGGEEFVIILPNTNSREATKIAEKVRKLVKNLQIQHSVSSEEYVTVSLGVATMMPSETMSKEILIQLADQALYEAKSDGRNRVIVKNN